MIKKELIKNYLTNIKFSKNTKEYNILLKGLLFAINKHNGQFRRYTNLPYILHPIAVSQIIQKYKKSKHLSDLMVVGLLHDTLEDTDTNFSEISENFSPFIASLVLELTSNKSDIDKIGKLEYIKSKMKGMSSYALTIKLADRLQNISEQPTKKMILDTMETMTYLRDVRKLTKPQILLTTKIYDLCENKLKEKLKIEQFN